MSETQYTRLPNDWYVSWEPHSTVNFLTGAPDALNENVFFGCETIAAARRQSLSAFQVIMNSQNVRYVKSLLFAFFS